MVVVIQPRFGQLTGLFLGQLAQCHAGFQPELAHALDHLQHVRHVLVGRMLPGRAHTETGGTNRLGSSGLFQHLLDFKEFFLVQPGVVMT